MSDAGVEREQYFVMPPLIIGAGPVGLSAALFLARQGIMPRVIEKRLAPSAESRALGVNPRTLELLAPSGVTARMLQMGRRIHGGRFSRVGGGKAKLVATLEFDGLHPEYPSMLALSQSATERLLEAAVQEAGGSVERGPALVECRTEAGEPDAPVTAVIECGGMRRVLKAPWLLAADGARSTVRKQLGLGFPGSSFPDDWHLADVPLRTELAEDRVHIFFLERGALLFFIRVIDPELEPPGAPLWRVVSNRPAPLEILGHLNAIAEVAQPAGPVLWESSFTISHRTIESMARPPVYFAGDAAHIHSPIGARSMNLGIEDAWVFARCAAAQRLDEYDRLRRRVDRQVVRQVHLLSRVAAAQPRGLRLLRRFGLPVATSLEPVRQLVLRTVTGLDHDLPRIEGGEAVG